MEKCLLSLREGFESKDQIETMLSHQPGKV
jgi:hypothetical protein